MCALNLCARPLFVCEDDSHLDHYWNNLPLSVLVTLDRFFQFIIFSPLQWRMHSQGTISFIILEFIFLPLWQPLNYKRVHSRCINRHETVTMKMGSRIWRLRKTDTSSWTCQGCPFLNIVLLSPLQQFKFGGLIRSRKFLREIRHNDIISGVKRAQILQRATPQTILGERPWCRSDIRLPLLFKIYIYIHTYMNDCWSLNLTSFKCSDGICVLRKDSRTALTH